MQVQLDFSLSYKHIYLVPVKRIITFAAANIKENCPIVLTDAGFHRDSFN